MDVTVIEYDEGLNESIIQKKTEKVLVVRVVFTRKKLNTSTAALYVNRGWEKRGNVCRNVGSIA